MVQGQQYGVEEDHGPMDEEEQDDAGSSSEDEIISMCRNNLVQQQNFILQLVSILGMYSDNYFLKLPKRVTGDSGLDWVHETLARDSQCYNMFRVERPLFYRLHNTLVQRYDLKSTKQMTSVEALAMFLWIVGAPQSVRQTDNRFRRSLETVSRTFNRVLRCLLRLAHDNIKSKDSTFAEVHPNLENPAFWPHFNDCIGAIDGTHVKVVVDKSKRIPYLNRHRETSQNVLAICNFDMRFTFVLSGWPGSAHDMRVFKDAITSHHHKFPHPPPGKYYVVDAGYPNCPGYLSPYRCTRYHVEQWHNGPPPQGMKEIFNHAHAKVRNVIERTFGVLKMKFRILLNMPRFSEEKQTRIIVACMALHNFIRDSRIADREFDACDADGNYNPMPSSSSSTWPEDEPLVEDVNMNAFRDELAHALFH
ncbi:hypothetical protein U9M48_033285 [Paspalum notatum var. saurae]|uniref:DDE Tnp4 domain-containing protein n=1 Tax=Paspalum notatum var. saurae TaxID=547442 RepID=A0AAQ3U730_PASNO